MRRLLPAIALLGLGAACSGGEQRVPPPPAGAGNIIIRWSFEDPDGASLTCDDLQIAEAEVAIGGTPTVVPCGEMQEVAFDNIIPGRIPVVIRLLNSIGLEFDASFDNAIIVDKETLQYEHVFVVDEQTFERGTLDVNWRIDMRIPAQTCGLVEATTMRIATRPGSISTFEMEAPCVDGRLIIPDLRRGAYDLILWLVQEDGTLLDPPETVTGVGVFAGDSTRVSVSFRTIDPRPRTVLTRWTVDTSTPTAQLCLDTGVDEVRVSLEAPNPLNGVFELVDTATTGCASGSATVLGTVADDHRLTARLIDTFGVAIATEVVNEIDLRIGSATIAVDFDTMD